jgi:hypothetical protein
MTSYYCGFEDETDERLLRVHDAIRVKLWQQCIIVKSPSTWEAAFKLVNETHLHVTELAKRQRVSVPAVLLSLPNRESSQLSRARRLHSQKKAP